MEISEFGTKIKNNLWYYIKDFLYYQRVADSPVIQNLNFNFDPNQKKAVMCYLTSSYFINWETKKIDRMQPLEIMKIVNILSGLGYCVDVIGCNDIKALEVIKKKKYDLIFGFGETFYQLTSLYPDATSILYVTENHPEFSYKEEKKRLDYYHERYGRRIKMSRSGKYYKTYHLQKKYSYVITMSDNKLYNNHIINKYHIFPIGLTNNNYVFENKNHLLSRKQFLWLGSTGAIHKGLDLLLNIFIKQNDIVLHICGFNKYERKYLKLPNKNNIIDHGHIDINSEIFLNLNKLCSYIILPSCSEGFSTSITTGMIHGLIPVVMRDTGFNKLGEIAVFFEDYKLDYLHVKINELANMDPEKLTILSRQSYDFARQHFTIPAYGQNFTKIMDDILRKK